jgi:membrane fusion protein (multidrug efflux system)
MGLDKGALMVPQRAVSELQGNYQVAVVDANDTVRIRNVKVGERFEQFWIIQEGLKIGERVIAEGIQKVHEGVRVNPKPYAVKP